MNKEFLNKVIDKVKVEKCRKHDKVASFQVADGVVIIGDYCCSDFYKSLTERIQEEIDKQTFLF